MSSCLFLCGTLLPEHAQRKIAPIIAKLRPLGRPTVPGVLYDLGDFLALRLHLIGEEVCEEAFHHRYKIGAYEQEIYWFQLLNKLARVISFPAQ